MVNFTFTSDFINTPKVEVELVTILLRIWEVQSSRDVMAHGDAREGKWMEKLANGVGSQYSSLYLRR